MSSDAPSACRSSPTSAWVAVALLTTCNALCVVDRQALSLLASPIRADASLSDIQIGLLQGPALTLLFLLAGLPLGRLADAVSRRLLITVGMVAWSLSVATFALAPGFPAMFLARSCAALGEALLVPASCSLFAELFGARRLGVVMAVFVTGAVLGNGAGMVLAGALHALWASSGFAGAAGEGTAAWRLTFASLAAPGLIAAAAVAGLVPDAARGRDGRVRRLSRELPAWIWRGRGFYLPLLAAYICFSVAVNAFLAWTPSYAVRELGLSPAAAGAQLGLLLLAGGAVAPAAFGCVADRLHGRWGDLAGVRLLGVAMVLASLVALVAFRGLSPGPRWPGVGALAILLLGPGLLVTLVAQITTPPWLRGQMIAVITLFGYLIGQNAGALLPPLLASRAGGIGSLGSSLTLVISGAAALAAVGCFLVRRPAVEGCEP